MEAVTTEKRFISLREKLEAAKLTTIPARVEERKLEFEQRRASSVKTVAPWMTATLEQSRVAAELPSDVVFRGEPRIVKVKPPYRCFRCSFDLNVFCTLCAAWSRTNDLTTARALFVNQESIW